MCQFFLLLVDFTYPISIDICGVYITMYYNTFHIYFAQHITTLRWITLWHIYVKWIIELNCFSAVFWCDDEKRAYSIQDAFVFMVKWFGFFVFKEGRLFNLLMWYGFLVIRIEWSFKIFFFVRPAFFRLLCFVF